MSRRFRRKAALSIALSALVASLASPASGVVGLSEIERAGAVAPATAAAQSGSTIQGPASADHSAVRLTPQEPAPSVTGFDSLFIGHSFFIPIAQQMPFHAANAGFPDHTQVTVSSGGSGGAPQALWENPDKRAEVQAVLDGGDIEMFGMTYHPDYPGLEGYQNWVDDALANNPTTTFFVGLPWLTSPATMDASTYAATWQDAYETIAHGIIDDLRLEYPDTDFFAIPYGRAAVELYTLFAAGDLPEIDSLVSTADDGIFSDSFGHAGQILRELSVLVWLRAIYGVEISNYDYDPGYSVDLKALADSIIVGQDARYNAP